MASLKIFSPAKVNLVLDVLEREKSGYHIIRTVYHEVKSLCDILFFKEIKGGKIKVEFHGLRVECAGENTIMKAADFLRKKYKIKNKGIKIDVEKKIPLKSGLGGPASNAATTLIALNEIWGLNLSKSKLIEHASEIGMDAPFFVLGGCAEGTHYGEKIAGLPILDELGIGIEIINTGIQISTKEAYAGINIEKCGNRIKDTNLLVEFLERKREKTRKNHSSKSSDFKFVESLLHNDFETLEQNNFKAVATGTHLSGSGGARFRLVTI